MNSLLFTDSRDQFIFSILCYNVIFQDIWEMKRQIQFKMVSFPTTYQLKWAPIELSFHIQCCPHFRWTSSNIFLPTNHFVPVLFELIYMGFQFDIFDHDSGFSILYLGYHINCPPYRIHIWFVVCAKDNLSKFYFVGIFFLSIRIQRDCLILCIFSPGC